MADCRGPPAIPATRARFEPNDVIVNENDVMVSESDVIWCCGDAGMVDVSVEECSKLIDQYEATEQGKVEQLMSIDG